MICCQTVVIHRVRKQPPGYLHIKELRCRSTYCGALAVVGTLVGFWQIIKNVADEKRSSAECEHRNERSLVCTCAHEAGWANAVLCSALAAPTASWRAKRQLLCVPNQIGKNPGNVASETSGLNWIELHWGSQSIPVGFHLVLLFRLWGHVTRFSTSVDLQIFYQGSKFLNRPTFLLVCERENRGEKTVQGGGREGKRRSKQNLFCWIWFVLSARTSKCETTDFTVERGWKRQLGFPCWGNTFKFLLASF